MRKAHKLIAYGISGLIAFGFVLAPATNAQELNLPTFDETIGGLENTIPGPIRNFINSAKQIGEDITYKTTTKFNFSNFDFSNPFGGISGLYTKADDWVFRATGLHIKEVLRGVLNIAVSILSFILNIFRWILSLVQ